MPVYRGGPVEIDFDYVVHRLRIDDVQSSRNARYVAALKAGIPLITDNSEPAIFYERFEHTWEREGILRAGTSVLKVGDLVWKQLRDARSISVGIATIGPGAEEQIRRVKEQHGILQALALEAISAIALDVTIEGFFRRFEEQIGETGLFAGVPVSPGETIGWGIEDQRTIYSLLQTELRGITITESCLLIPKNSVSFVRAMSAVP